jgi:predicted O-linked N-acetylglucosamine transferase (SPINDLY family)
MDMDPENAEARLQLALTALSGRREEEAVRWLQEALVLEPKFAEAHLHLANLWVVRGNLPVAEEHYRQAVAVQPAYAEAHANLGRLLKDLGRRDEAAVHLARALQLKPELTSASFNLAMLRIDQNNWDEALALLHQTLAGDGRQADAHYWLGNGLMRQGSAAQARESYRAAIALNSNFERARWGLAMAQLPAIPQVADEQTEGVKSFRQEIRKLESWIVSHRPPNAYQAVGAQQPYYLAYVPGNHREVMSDYGALCVKLMQRWADKAGMAAPVRTGGAKCRIGIVSAHICSHSVWHAIVRGWVEHLDPEKFEIHLFHTGEQRDAETQWAAARVNNRLHYALGDWTSWAKTISGARLDAVIYPEIGMDATSLRLASMKLARVQMAGWGHPITTGLPTVNAYISAAAFEPQAADSHYTETLLALPRLGCCYRPFGTRPDPVDPARLGISPKEKILLCAGMPFKYAPDRDAILLEVARRCAPCKLVFFRTTPALLSDMLETRLRGVFALAGMNFDEYVRFIPWQSQAGFFGLLDRADVYLDSIGFSGFNTTMQAMERATPIVAWEGDTMRSRFASGILCEAGMSEWVARSGESYVDKVAQLCADDSLRRQLRTQIAQRRDALYSDVEAVSALGAQLLRLT